MSEPIRIWRLNKMDYYGDDIAAGLRSATPETLDAVRRAGFTGILVAVRLRTVSQTDAFPSLGDSASSNQRRIAELARRCANHRLKLYLYLCEPRGFASDDSFWVAYPEVRGAAGGSVMDGYDESFALCTSGPRTLEFLEQGCADLFAAVPGLGGVVCMSASEHHTHCYSHFDVRNVGLGEHWGQQPGDTLGCDRCRQRTPRDIVAEVLAAIERGVHRSMPEADVIAWTWSWDLYDPPPQSELIGLLPESIVLMSDVERGGELRYQGQTLPVDEYSLNYVGPSDRCRGQIETAQRTGHRAMVRFQINNTVEMATAPNLPLIANLFCKLRALSDLGVSDAMVGWNFGCRLDTLNIFAARKFWQDTTQREEEAFLSSLAAEYFGLTDGEAVARAWRAFAVAIEPYPFGFGFLYFGPFNCGLTYPLLNHEPRTRSMKIWNFDSDGLGDRLEETFGLLTRDQMLSRLEALHRGWSAVVEDYERALSGAARTDRAADELNVAKYFTHLAHSTWTIYAWFVWRYDRQSVPRLTAGDVESRLRAEMKNLETAEGLLLRDDRLGFFEEDQKYYATPAKVREKRRSVEALLELLCETELENERGRPCLQQP